ncbi:hypothetical protein D6783_05240 [Candidatus Woesearchaeota archaeon]|nr:MAG: hypothetical protein D6783_05240 [Candidatus Woesearchaeota archaeon]
MHTSREQTQNRRPRREIGAARTIQRTHRTRRKSVTTGIMNRDGATKSEEGEWMIIDNEIPISPRLGFLSSTQLRDTTTVHLSSAGEGGFFAMELGRDARTENLPEGTEAVYVLDFFGEQIVFYLHRARGRKTSFLRTTFSAAYKPFKVERRKQSERVDLHDFAWLELAADE